jgi:hypothetical protein
MRKGGFFSKVYEDEVGEDYLGFSSMEMELGSHISQASGEGIPVVLSECQVEGYRVSSHARLVLDGDLPYIKAGFLDDFRPNYEPKIERSSFDIQMQAMEAYAEGLECDELIIRAYLAPPPQVVYEQPIQPELSLVNILEKAAIRQVSGKLCLLNPSMGTVWRAEEEGKYFSVAYTRGVQNDENRQRFERTFQHLIRDGKHDYFPELDQDMIDINIHYFCGMSGVHKWVVHGSGFDPNVFDPQFISESVTSLEEIEGGVSVRHWRKDYETIREWLYHPHYYRYSAASFLAPVAGKFKDSNYYQNELTAYLDRFFFCTTTPRFLPQCPFSPTPCGKVFFPAGARVRVWWEGDQPCAMYQYDEKGIRKLVWVDMGYSYYSSKALLENIAATLKIPIMETSPVPNGELVLYPLSSVPQAVCNVQLEQYVLGKKDKVWYQTAVMEENIGYECQRCGMWQVGKVQGNGQECAQCQNLRSEILIGIGPEVSRQCIIQANRSPGKVVKMKEPGLRIVVRPETSEKKKKNIIRAPDIILQNIAYFITADGVVKVGKRKQRTHKEIYVFWGRREDYPGKAYNLRYGEWARYDIYFKKGRATWKNNGDVCIPKPRVIIKRSIADWYDTTTQATLASVPIMDWVTSIMPRTLSSAKGVDDGKAEVIVEECDWFYSDPFPSVTRLGINQ